MAHAREWVFPAKLDGNYDGDTFSLELDLGFHVKYCVSVRLEGVDTPELRGGTPLTKALAKLARDKAEDFIRCADSVLFHSTAWKGKYGRPVGHIVCDGKPLSEHLISNKLGVPYDGGSRSSFLVQHQVNAEQAQKDGLLDDFLA